MRAHNLHCYQCRGLTNFICVVTSDLSVSSSPRPLSSSLLLLLYVGAPSASSERCTIDQFIGMEPPLSSDPLPLRICETYFILLRISALLLRGKHHAAAHVDLESSRFIAAPSAGAEADDNTARPVYLSLTNEPRRPSLGGVRHLLHQLRALLKQVHLPRRIERSSAVPSLLFCNKK